MSIRMLARVWESSRHSGTHLLMLLAIADFANDDGEAYPSIATLAAKCRMKARNAQTLIATLRQSGELLVSENAGPRGANLYRIAKVEGVQSLAGVQTLAGVQSLARGGAKPCAKPMQGIAPEPSLNRQEPCIAPVGARHQQADDSNPGTRKTNRKTSKPAIPVDAIVQAYHEALPCLSRVKRPDANGRPKAIARLWAVALERAANGPDPAGERALAWVRRYFEGCAADDFITGRRAPGAGHEGWRADLDYVLRDKTITRIVERGAPRPAVTIAEAAE